VAQVEPWIEVFLLLPAGYSAEVQAGTLSPA
jgi:hypothetical protein